MIFKHKTDHERVPERVIWQTESYPQDAFNNWKITRDFSYVIGDMVWTGLDYLGESGIGGWRYKSWPQGESWQQLQFPWHGAYCGDVNVIGERKPVSFYRDLLWNGEITSPKSTDTAKKMHIAVYEPDGYVEPIKTSQWSTWPTWHSWDWSAWEGKNIDVVVYSRHPKVRLLINNKVVDEKVTGENEQFKAKFTLPYEKGEIKAVGLDENGNEIESVLLKSSDKPSKISLLTDKNEYVADGQGLAYIDVALTDKNGIVCSKNENELKVNIDGTASLVAFGNANLRDTGVYTDAVHQLWNGKGLIVVRAPKKSETSIVTVTGDNLKPVKLKIRWK
jgi:beta-galactosidase